MVVGGNVQSSGLCAQHGTLHGMGDGQLSDGQLSDGQSSDGQLSDGQLSE